MTSFNVHAEQTLDLGGNLIDTVSVSAEPELELSHNLIDANETPQTWQGYTRYHALTSRYSNGVDIDFTLLEGNESHQNRVGIFLEQKDIQYEEGNVYVIEGYVEIDGNPLDNRLFDWFFVTDRGFFHNRGATELLTRHHNPHTGYVREVYRIIEEDSHNRFLLHSIGHPRMIGSNGTINNTQVREVLNSEEVFEG